MLTPQTCYSCAETHYRSNQNRKSYEIYEDLPAPKKGVVQQANTICCYPRGGMHYADTHTTHYINLHYNTKIECVQD